MKSAASHNESVTENVWKSLLKLATKCNKNSRLVGHLSLHGHAWYQANASLSWICFEALSLLGKESRKPSHHIDTWHITVFTYSVQSYSISPNKGKVLCKNVTFHALERPKLRRLTWSIYQILVAQLRCKHLGIQAQPASARTQKKCVKEKKTAAQGSKIAWAKSPSASSGKIHCAALPFTLSSFLPLRISPW